MGKCVLLDFDHSVETYQSPFTGSKWSICCFMWFFPQTVSAKGEYCLSHKGVAVAFQTFKSFKTHFGFSALSHFVLRVWMFFMPECFLSDHNRIKALKSSLQYVCLLPYFSLKDQTQQSSTDNRRYLHVWQVAPVYPVPSHVQLKLSHVCLHRPPCSQWLGIHL